MLTKYKIYCTNWEDGVKFDYPLLDSDLAAEAFYLKNPKLIKEINTLEQLTFKIYSNHPNYAQLKIRETVVKVYQETGLNKKIIFKGKIVKEKFNFDKSKDITCEGLLGTLADNRFNDIRYLGEILNAGDYMAGDIFNCGFGENEEYLHHGWFEEAVVNYNNQFCKTIDQIKIGEICPNVPKNSSLKKTLRYHVDFYRSGSGTTIKVVEPVFEQIKGKTLLEILSWLIEHGVYYTEDPSSNPYPLKYFVPTYDENNTYLNIYTDYDLETQKNEQKIVFGENMIDLAVEQDSNNVVTAIIPVGQVSVPDGTGENMKTEEVELTYWGPGAHQYESNEDILLMRKFMYSKSGVEKYGWIIGDQKASTFSLGWSQGTAADQLNLQREAANFLLKQGSRIKEVTTINAADLAYASGYDVGAFQFLKHVEINAPKHLSKTLNYLITKVELNLVEPEKNKITFNQTSTTSTGGSGSSIVGGGSGISGSVTSSSSTGNQKYSDLQLEVNNIKTDYATNAYVNSTFPTSEYVNSTFATAEYVSSIETGFSSYIDQQAEEILATVKEDTSIVKTATYYQVVESTEEEGALEVIADGVEPTETQINIGDLASCDCDVEVGDYVVLISASKDYEAMKQQLQSLVSQTSSALELNFLTETVLNAINEATGEVDSKYSFVNNYFRFDADGSLLIGQVDNPFILKLTNDRISFIEDSVEIAYISNNKLYITDGEFLNSLDIGNFTFTPRTNGNLSFKLR